ncbi:MAG: hypothetical protein ACFFCW_47760 [Candidatus Hodarchaeota archaeon]
MATELKDKVLEIAAIAKECPENLQEKCFEVLLKDFLETESHLSGGRVPTRHPPPPGATKESGLEEDLQKEYEPPQEDFSEKDLHVKLKKFLQSSNLTVDHINQIFYKEGEKILPLYDDLKTTKSSESQLRIAMLQALKNAMYSGEFDFDGEEVRAECQLRKCYDSPNFAANFKNNKDLFDDFTKYNKKSPVIRLSSEGKSGLAELIRDLQ